MQCSPSSRRCGCFDGYHHAPIGIDRFGCVQETTNLTRGMKCYDTIQCLFGMSCDQNRCSCRRWQKAVGDFACADREIGDSCQSDSDCGKVENGFCDRQLGVCTCQGPYFKAFPYIDRYGEKKYSCGQLQSFQLLNDSANPLAAEGQACNSWPSRGKIIPCRVPFICTACSTEQGTICARMLLKKNSTKKTLPNLF